MAFFRNRWATFFLVVFLLAPLTMAAKVKEPRAARHRDQKTIESLENQWVKAVQVRDTVTLEKMMGDDFLGIAANGALSDKQQYLDHLRTGRFEFNSIDVTDSKVRLMGDVAIVNSMADIDATFGGVEYKGKYRYTRVYRRLPSVGWKVVNFESTRISPHASQSEMQNGIPIER